MKKLLKMKCNILINITVLTPKKILFSKKIFSMITFLHVNLQLKKSKKYKEKWELLHISDRNAIYIWLSKKLLFNNKQLLLDGSNIEYLEIKQKFY